MVSITPTVNQAKQEAAKLGLKVDYSGKDKIMYVKYNRNFKNNALVLECALISAYGSAPDFKLKNE